MSWLYFLSGLVALVITIYLVIAFWFRRNTARALKRELGAYGSAVCRRLASLR